MFPLLYVDFIMCMENIINEGSYCNVLGIFERLYSEEIVTITGDGYKEETLLMLVI